jgi:hypothetical protein
VNVRSIEITVASTLFAVFAAMVAAAASYPQEARLVPLIVGVPAMALAGWQLWRELTGERAKMDEPATNEGASIAWLAFFALLVLAGGFVAGGTIAVMVCQRFWLRERWRTALIGGAVALFVSYACFERGLGLTLFGGWIANWVRG